MNHIQYRIITWQESYGRQYWSFIIRKYRRVIFKRSKREGWRKEGFVAIPGRSDGYPTRAEALAAAKAAREEILAR